MSDRGHIVEGRIVRHKDQIIGVRSSQQRALEFPEKWPGVELVRDTEGIAIDPAGRVFVSLEGISAILAKRNDDTWFRLPNAPAFSTLPENRGLEALATDGEGAVFAVPESSENLVEPFPVFRYRDTNGWDIPIFISRSEGFVPVGADFDAYDRLYVLERSFNGFGFRSRVRRFSLDAGEVQDGEILLVSKLREHDNLEGIGVWQTDDGELRLTLISDDNFNWFQKTEIVEYGLSN